MNTIQDKCSPSKRQSPISSPKIPIKHRKDFQIMVNQKLMSLKSVKRRDAELWKWNLMQTEYGKGNTMMRRAARALKTIQNIRTLYLIQCCRSITDIGLKHLCSSLKRHESLKSLHLCIDSCFSVGSKGLYDVGQSLKRLPRLETLSLNFAGPGSRQITDKEFLGFNKGLKALVNLRKISLNFCDCPLQASGIKNLSEGLKRHNRLESIDFTFLYCTAMSDKELKSIGDICRRNPNLQRVFLRFFHCLDPTDVGLKYLGEGLEKLVSLEEILLRFSGCRKTSDEGLENLAESLIKLKKLREVNLWFCGSGMTKLGQNRAAEGLKEVKKVSLEVLIDNDTH